MDQICHTYSASVSGTQKQLWLDALCGASLSARRGLERRSVTANPLPQPHHTTSFLWVYSIHP